MKYKTPCKTHKAAYPSLNIPEVQNFKHTLTMCLKCKYFIKRSEQ